MDKQKLFDSVVKHLRDQGVPSMGGPNGSCLYRSPQEDGTVLKCAAGFLITDEQYNAMNDVLTVKAEGNRLLKKSIENTTIDGVFDKFPDMFMNLIPHKDLISELQIAHDGAAIETYRESKQHLYLSMLEVNLKDLAETHKLTYTPPENTA